jgi:lysozyme
MINLIIATSTLTGLPVGGLQVTEEVINLIKEEEGLVLHAYWDVDSYAIGYGSKRGVYAGMSISTQEADIRLREDVFRAENQVREELADVPLTPNQFSALVSLVYNAGPAPILPGTTIRRALDRGDYQAAANGFNLWVTDGYQTLPSLVDRRALESSIFRRIEPRQVTLRALRNTYIKNRPTSSILDLEPNEFSLIEEGTSLSINLLRLVDSHYEIDVEGNKRYIFSSHFTLP